MYTQQPKVTEYRIVWASNAAELNLEVEVFLNLGYQPYGSPFCSNDPKDKLKFYQAMVKFQDQVSSQNAKNETVNPDNFSWAQK